MSLDCFQAFAPESCRAVLGEVGSGESMDLLLDLVACKKDQALGLPRLSKVRKEPTSGGEIRDCVTWHRELLCT